MVARIIEEKFPALKETHPEVLARHWTEAGLSFEAIQYWKLAGRRAAEHSAHAEAIGHLTKGLEPSIATGDGKSEYTPIGHTANLAARMQTLANPGSTVIAESTPFVSMNSETAGRGLIEEQS